MNEIGAHHYDYLPLQKCGSDQSIDGCIMYGPFDGRGQDSGNHINTQEILLSVLVSLTC